MGCSATLCNLKSHSNLHCDRCICLLLLYTRFEHTWSSKASSNLGHRELASVRTDLAACNLIKAWRRHHGASTHTAAEASTWQDWSPGFMHWHGLQSFRARIRGKHALLIAWRHGSEAILPSCNKSFGLTTQSPDEDAAMKAVDEAFKRGVNFFDVAPFYASGDAERVCNDARICCRIDVCFRILRQSQTKCQLNHRAGMRCSY